MALSMGTFLFLFTLSSVTLGSSSSITDDNLSDPVLIFPYPRIVLLGPSGVGKSSLANVLAGCPPNDDSCFPTCNGEDSCTENTTVHVVTYLGNSSYGELTIVDTPGFGDSGGDGDTSNINNMIDVLKHTLGNANLLLLCQEYGRFQPGIQKMILEIEALFGRDRIWNHIMIEVTKWGYGESDILKRNLTGITEESALADINEHLQSISHLNQSLPGVFLDSFSQFFPDDVKQQQYFNMYAKELWDLALSMPTLEFFTIEDILEELNECKLKVDCLNEIIEERIVEVEKNMNHNTENIATLKSEVIINHSDILTNQEVIAAHYGETRVNTEQISNANVNIDANKDMIEANSDNIDENLVKINANSGKIEANSKTISENSGSISHNLIKINTNIANIKKNTDSINSINQHTNVHQCGSQNEVDVYPGETKTVTYDSITSGSSSNDGSTLSKTTGIFTAHTAGLYQITQTSHKGSTTEISIKHNGKYFSGFYLLCPNQRTWLEVTEHLGFGGYITDITFCVVLVQDQGWDC